MAIVDTTNRFSDTSSTVTSTMMDRPDYGHQAAQEAQLQQQLQLYQELKFRFPGASQAVLMGTMQRHGNHRERCLEELTLFCRSSYQPGQWSLQQQMHMPLHPSQQATYGNQQFTKVTPGSRSRSVSGVSGGDGFRHPYGFRYTSDEVVGCPQTAPVMSTSVSGHSGSSYASPVYYFRSPAPQQPAPSNPSPMQHSASYGSIVTSPSSQLPKPPRPPVPPPTYRNHLDERQHVGDEQSPPVMPIYPDIVGTFPRNVMIAPSSVRHNMMLNFTPVYPNLRSIYNEWETEQQQQQQQHQQQQHHVQQPGLTAGFQPSPSLMMGSTSSFQQQQHQSTLHISVSPNGYSIPGMISPSGSNSTTKSSGLPKLQFKRRESSHGGSDKSPARNSPGEGSHRKMECPFDVDDPEQENLSHKPLRPLPSPTAAGVQSSASGSGSAASSSSVAAPPIWPCVLPPVGEQSSGDVVGVVQEDEAFTNALIIHQKQRLALLQRELSHESQRLQEALTEVTSLEQQLFRRRTRFHDQVFPTFDDIQRLWSEIRSYSVDCECMTHVVDHLHKGQVPLGETNEDFYKSINTGQQMQVLQPPTVARQGGGSPTPLAVGNGPLSASASASTSPIPTALCSEHDGAGHVNATSEERDKWSCSACTFLNDHALERCEMCEMPRVVLGGMHNLRIQVRQSPNRTTATNKALQLKLTHKLGLPKRMH